MVPRSTNHLLALSFFAGCLATLAARSFVKRSFGPPMISTDEQFYNYTDLAWLTMSMEKVSMLARDDCTKLGHYGLSINQIKQCRSHPDLMDAVAIAATMTKMACQGVAEPYRWNCSSLNLMPHYDKDLTGGPKEQAFVQALSAATLTWVVSKWCASGRSRFCECAEVDSSRKWNKKLQEMISQQMLSPYQSGCSEDLPFALKFSRRYTDQFMKSYKKKKRSSDIRTIDKIAVALHNTDLGRKVVKSVYKIKCKCIGPTGSCTSKICFGVLPAKFGEMARAIKDAWINSHKLWAGEGSQEQQKLALTQPSPDYCERSPIFGSVGTYGRRCFLGEGLEGQLNCHTMCCGRGWQTIEQVITEKCNCKVIFSNGAARTPCEVCSRVETQHFCNAAYNYG